MRRRMGNGSGRFLLPLVGFGFLLVLWQVSSWTWAKDLPSPAETWEKSRIYILQPLAKRGEMDQGLLRYVLNSLALVAQGYGLGLLAGTLFGLLLGCSPVFTRMFDPVVQMLKPISPLAWLPLGLVLFQNTRGAAVFTIALCSMWPTVMNTALGLRNVPQDYLNVGRVLRLSRLRMLWKILLPSALPYMFTGYRLSLGIAWLAIVAAEMLTGTPGIGGFLWQEYNALIYEHILVAILAIGLVGWVLDRCMLALERWITTSMS